MPFLSSVKTTCRRQKERLSQRVGRKWELSPHRVIPKLQARRSPRLTLRLCYWHQHPEGELFDHRRTLAQFFTGYLEALNQQSPAFDWSCRPVHLDHTSTQSHSIVAVAVEFVHNSLAHDDTINGPEKARRLWAQLANLSQTDEFRNIFGVSMISMNIYAMHVHGELQRAYARAVMVQDLSVEKITTVSSVPDPWESILDDAILLSPIVVDLIKLVVPARAATSYKPYGANLAATKIPEGASPTQLAANIASGQIQTARQASMDLSASIKKFWEIHKTNKKESREVAEKISKSLASASTLFHDAFKKVQSRLEKIYKADNPTFEDVWSALVAIHTMHLLYPRFKDALDILMTFRNLKRRRNIIIGGGIALIAGVLAIFAASCFVGPAAVVGPVAWAAGIGGTASAGVSVEATHIALDNFFEGSVLERMEQMRTAFQETSMAVNYYLAVCWLENICHISFESAPLASQEALLKKLGVDRACWQEPGYQAAWLESSAGKLTNDYNELKTLVAGLFTKMDVKVDMSYKESQKAAQQESETETPSSQPASPPHIQSSARIDLPDSKKETHAQSSAQARRGSTTRNWTRLASTNRSHAVPVMA